MSINYMQFIFMPGNGTTGAILILSYHTPNSILKFPTLVLFCHDAQHMLMLMVPTMEHPGRRVLNVYMFS